MELTKFKISLLPLDFGRSTLTSRRKSSSKASRIAKDGSSSSTLSTSQSMPCFEEEHPKGKGNLQPFHPKSHHPAPTQLPPQTDQNLMTTAKPFILNSLPLGEGGLGIRNLMVFNCALLGKWL